MTMFSEKDLIHPEWGMIRITVNRCARRIIMRADSGCIRMTVPPLATNKDIEKALATHGDKLKRMQSTAKPRCIDCNYSIGEGSFRITLEEYKGKNFMWVHNGATHTLMCPEYTDYNKIQEWLQRVVKNAIQEKAKNVLPPRLASLAKRHGFRYTGCSVRNSHSRWGSCSGKGSISLSMYLVLLPDELIEYVLLHELCHTVEMNHGERFWALLDKACHCNSREIRAKLKKYTPDI